MNWECHIQNICKKIASSLGAIKRIRHLIPFNILINVYDILVQPHFNYCNVTRPLIDIVRPRRTTAVVGEINRRMNNV